MFKNKNQMKLHFKTILNKGFLTAEDQDNLRWLIKKHKEHIKKVGCGIEKFYVDTAPNNFNTKCFFIKRIDGTVTDFSYLSCITNKTTEADLKEACRQIIRPQIVEFRESLREYKSDISGVIIKRRDLHIDHAPPNTFKKILEDWKKLIDKKFRESDFIKTLDNSAEVKFKDKGLELSFYNFHKKKAKLRCLTAQENLRLKKTSEGDLKMYKNLNLSELKKEYAIEIKKYLKQEKWLESNPKRAEVEIDGKVPLNMFKATISNLGLLGYEMENRFNHYQTIEERFGKIGEFQELVVKQLKI